MAPRRESLPRSAALIALGALVVHQLRYALATGGHPGEELAAQGHAYMSDAVPVLAAFVVAALAAGLLRALSGRKPGAASEFRHRVLGFALALFAVFAFQESLEGLIASGHPSGFAAVFAGGGWLAMPLAVLIGAVCAVGERRMVGLERRVAVAVRTRRARMPRAQRRAPRPTAFVLAPARSPLAFGGACRPPPRFPLPG